MGWESVLVRGNRMYKGCDVKKNVTHLKDWRAELGQVHGHVAVSPSGLIPVCMKQGGRARRPPYSGSENLMARVGVARTPLSISFALCKMGSWLLSLPGGC